MGIFVFNLISNLAFFLFRIIYCIHTHTHKENTFGLFFVSFISYIHRITLLIIYPLNQRQRKNTAEKKSIFIMIYLWIHFNKNTACWINCVELAVQKKANKPFFSPSYFSEMDENKKENGLVDGIGFSVNQVFVEIGQRLLFRVCIFQLGFFQWISFTLFLTN